MTSRPASPPIGRPAEWISRVQFHGSPFVIEPQEALERIRDPAQFGNRAWFVWLLAIRYSVHVAAASLAANR
jgi:hypothetical protein